MAQNLLKAQAFHLFSLLCIDSSVVDLDQHHRVSNLTSPRENYECHVNRLRLNFGVKASGIMAWGMFAPSSGLASCLEATERTIYFEAASQPEADISLGWTMKQLNVNYHSGCSFHSRASFCASAISTEVILEATKSRALTASSRFSVSEIGNCKAARLNHICART